MRHDVERNSFSLLVPPRTERCSVHHGAFDIKSPLVLPNLFQHLFFKVAFSSSPLRARYKDVRAMYKFSQSIAYRVKNLIGKKIIWNPTKKRKRSLNRVSLFHY